MNQRLYIRRGFLLTIMVFMCLIAISFIIFSLLASARLFNISKSYMVISALVSSFALVGVAISLLYQARAGHTAREQATRTLQQQLIKMQMEDPALMTAIGAPWGLPIPAESTAIRDYLYIHMWATFWAGNYVVGELNAAAVRGLARGELLNSKAGRTYWTAVRENVLSTNEGKYWRFARIVDDEYQKVIASKMPPADPVRITNHTDNPATHRKVELRHLALVGATLTTGVLAGRKLSQRRRREQ
ncbi:MAG TPA: DUF6082 family protein [Streptosporangiaceae bacterium]